MFAKSGVKVVGIDCNEELVDTLTQGKLTFEEEGLKELFKEVISNGIEFTTGYQKTDTYKRLLKIHIILKKSDILFCGLMERKAFKYGISKNKFYDYMAAKKPIIFASSVRDSLIDKAKAGITIKPHEPENLAKTIKHIYENIDTLEKQYGENGREYVEKNHTTEKIASAFLSVIEYTYKTVK
ncbi:hypothetical protein H0A61_00279 [Koleobacter methoxysyntrophicus]|uniref:UDP-glucose/GDP-mannose dehydrogenase N-terminal domain-containing protein n=1 Tax=Koleobacter methoxysyntrophicus TaxID=2751313 RepID=A0A8A0RJZ5_9FIRM|nr:hypothetical protein [Koleobacter methoxysyntrophicus]QSQ07960.1 hypothetical protein H0A61_00279 [Koleobacter methoxysyntrophicus]